MCDGGMDFSFSEWRVSYNGEDYPLKSFDLNDNGGSLNFKLNTSAIIDKTDWSVIEKHKSSNYLLHAGETVTLRTIGIIDTEPNSLGDGFLLTVAIPNSKGEYEYFTYNVPETTAE